MSRTHSVLVPVLFFAAGSAVALAQGPLPVTPAANQQELLQSSDSRLAANKKLAYDFYRIVLKGRRLSETSKFMREDYIQHNPNVNTGRAGFLDFFSKLSGPRPIPNAIADLVSIQAEGDFVTLSFVDERDVPGGGGKKYTTTGFDMFRFQDGKIAEHWDCDLKE